MTSNDGYRRVDRSDRRIRILEIDFDSQSGSDRTHGDIRSAMMFRVKLYGEDFDRHIRPHGKTRNKAMCFVRDFLFQQLGFVRRPNDSEQETRWSQLKRPLGRLESFRRRRIRRMPGVAESLHLEVRGNPAGW